MADDARTEGFSTDALDGARTGMRRDRDRLATQLGVGVIVLGFVLMGAGWFGASGKNFIQQQFPYLLSGGLPGLALVFIGGGILFVRDIRRERDAIESHVVRLAGIVEELARASAAVRTGSFQPAASSSANGSVVVGRTVFHDPTCRLVSAKPGLEHVSREDALASGLSPCRTCEP